MTITGSAQKMKPGEALTLYIDLEEGYFNEVKKFIDLTIPLYIGAIILFLLLGFHSFALWKRYGRDEPFVPVVRFEPPTDLSPLEVGYLFDGTVDMKDLSSMLFYWADLGYIQIEELGKKDYRIIKLKDLVSDKEHERRLFNAFFKRGDGTSVDLKNLSKSTTFAKDIEKTKSLTRSHFTGERELKDQNAERKRTVPFLYGVLLVVFHAWGTTYSYPGGVIFTLPLTFGIGLLVLTAVAIPKIFDSWMFARKGKALLKSGAFLLVYLASFGIIYIMYREEVLLSSALSLLFSASALGIPIIFATFGAITAKRSSYGQKILEEIVGYREFIEKVEIERKVMIKDDPSSSTMCSACGRLGLENTWAKKFLNRHDTGLLVHRLGWNPSVLLRFDGEQPHHRCDFKGALHSGLFRFRPGPDQPLLRRRRVQRRRIQRGRRGSLVMKKRSLRAPSSLLNQWYWLVAVRSIADALAIASLTRRLRPPNSLPSSWEIAASAALLSSISTNPKPLGRCVSRSMIMFALRTVPNWANSSRSSASEVL